jgi:hypothetical protein
MSEWGRAGGPLPHNPDLQRERQREMRDAIEHDRLAEAEQLRSRTVEASVVEVLGQALALTI